MVKRRRPKHPRVLAAFAPEQLILAHDLLAAKVASMLGRKLEEADWLTVYCGAKGFACPNWSNLSIDVIENGLGVEHKMLCVRSGRSIKEHCGTTMMHPAATRAIRIESSDGDATNIARDVLGQYAALIEQRRRRVQKSAPRRRADLRTGWLLWQESLDEFLYFEEEMLPPIPEDYYAEWKESGGGTRKKSRNLWVYEQATGKKRFSITTAAGAKIQPYFDVPPPNEPNLCYFRVQGEVLPNGLVRIWITRTTALLLAELVGRVDVATVSRAILEATREAQAVPPGKMEVGGTAESLQLTQEAYTALKSCFQGVSDEHMMQQLLHFLHKRR
jgi:hypothetical protein